MCQQPKDLLCFHEPDQEESVSTALTVMNKGATDRIQAGAKDVFLAMSHHR